MPPRRRDTLPKTHRRVPGRPATPTGAPRRISRREREARRRRQLYWGLGFAGALIVVILAVASLNEYWIKPRHVLATVNGTEIRRRDYWKYRAVDLADQANQYASIANSPFIDESQRQQYVTLAQQASEQIDDVWGSTALDEPTLQRMIDDQIYLQSLDEFGITITDQDVQDYIDQRFQQPDAPIFTPTPSPTLIPERAAWATETAAAISAAEEPAAASPEPAGSPVAVATLLQGDELASPQAFPPLLAASPEAATTPATSAQASPVGSPAAVVPEASPVAMEELSPTPNHEQARQTAAANFTDYRAAIFDRAHLSRSDYVRLIVRPAIARERIDAQLTAQVGQSAEQVRASHILVDTKDLADKIHADLISGADFAQTARDQSIDSGTAANGGDLGWFTRGQMVDPFEEVAFSTPPGEFSPPFQTEFGWHIVLVHEHAANRAMTDDQITQLRSSLVEEWLTAKKAEASIESEIEPTPTPAGPQNFVPPPDAPPLPTETPEPTLEPVASPFVEGATPVADTTSAGSPSASPIAASPVASPLP